MQRPEYHVLVEGQRHFNCVPLRATLSTSACGDRWQAPAPGSACATCELGRLHHADHHAGKVRRRARTWANPEPCVRCGRTDKRIITGTGWCICCANRTYEWLRRRNGKGSKPIKLRLQEFEVALQHANGRISRQIVLAAHGAEALARVLRRIPEGGRLLASERRETAWNAETGEFEIVCNRCGMRGSVLERCVGDGALQRHTRCCDGEPQGSGWQPAAVRRPVIAMPAALVAAVLNADPGLAGEAADMWTPTGIACECGAGQVEGLFTSPGGWRTRCGACGAAHECGRGTRPH